MLVTGGTGSFGHAFVRHALAAGAKRVIVFSRDENKQWAMRQAFPDERLSFFLGDVRDRDRLRRAFEADVDVVVHAAALKHVPSCEYNPFEAVSTNVDGARHVVEAAIDVGVERTIALSTDKAVAPVNLYGATKLCAEKIFVAGNVMAGARSSRFACVRYGNVIGSRGSIVPLLLEQRKTGRVTLTDERMTRFWLTLSDAVDLVMKALRYARGGEVFIPRAPSMRVRDLIAALAPDCAVETIGVRPGEKLHEMLISKDESRRTRLALGGYVILPVLASWDTPPIDDAGYTMMPVPDGWEYTSDGNSEWIDAGEFARQALEACP